MKLKWAPKAYKLLNGVFCIYKPSGIPVFKVIETIQNNLAQDLNALPCYKYEQLQVQPNSDVKTPVVTSVPLHETSLIGNRLVLGNRYVDSDFDIKFIHGLSTHASGLLVLSIGKSGVYQFKRISIARYLKVYHVQGRFGLATENYGPKGPVLDRSTYHHITKPLLDKICAATQSNHQKHMFEYAGVDPESQEAYELASKGIVRPQNNDTPPIVYGCKCIDFNLPDFTLEIHSINETTTFLQSLMHDIGLKLRSTAICMHVRRIRFGYFTLEHSLLRHYWNLENILDNIKICRTLLTRSKLLTSGSMKQISDVGVKRLSGGQDSQKLKDYDIKGQGSEQIQDDDSERLLGGQDSKEIKDEDMKILSKVQNDFKCLSS